MNVIMNDADPTPNGLTGFTNSFGFILFFLVGTLFFSMMFGDKAAVVFLCIVLAGMLVKNADKTVTLLGRYSK